MQFSIKPEEFKADGRLVVHAKDNKDLDREAGKFSKRLESFRVSFGSIYKLPNDMLVGAYKVTR